MKFLCGSCRTKYQISDEKVRGKILTIRCKKCGAKVVVKESLARAASLVIAPLADEASEQAQARSELRSDARSDVRMDVAGKVALGGSAASVSSATLASAFDVAMGGGLDDMPTSIAPTPTNEAYAGVEWYVAIDGSQVGPFAYAELVKKIQTKDVIGRHYVWHDGFDNWRRVRDVTDLVTYLPPDPSKKKPPPPPTPPGDEDNKVVDFAQKRAERDKRVGGAPSPSDELTAGLAADGLVARSPTSAPPPSTPGATPIVDQTSPGRDRVDQLDSVLNEALGINGEDKTARAEPNASSAALTAGLLSEPPAPADATSPVAAAILGPAGAQSAPVSEESFASDKSSDSFLPEDLFDKVPRASAQEMVARESTRFFVAAAGVNSQKKKNRFGIIAAGAGAIGLVVFAGLWAGGVIQISLPGIGNPFDRSAGPAVEAEKELALSDEELEQLKKLTAEEQKKRIDEIKQKRQKTRVAVKPRTKDTLGGGYVDDAPSTGPGGTRGGDVSGESAKIEMGGGTLPPGAKTETQLPGGNGPHIPVNSGGALTNEAIYTIVQQNVSAVTDCTRRERNAKAELKGKLEMSLTVEPDGTVSKVAVQTASFKGSTIASCIADRMRNWRFPTFSGPAQAIVVPFVFTSD